MSACSAPQLIPHLETTMTVQTPGSAALRTSRSWLAPEDRQAAQDVWRVYDRHFHALTEHIMSFAAGHPELGPLMASLPRAGLEERNRASRQRMQAVFAGDWAVHEDNLRKEGAAYAHSTLSFGAWCELLGAFQRRMLPLLMTELGGDKARLTAAVDLLLRFADRSLGVIGETYMETKQSLLAESERSKTTMQDRLAATELRNQAIKAESRQIQEANRLKSEFLANMSHELRTPLNAIIGFAELMHDGVVEPGSPQQTEFLNHILVSGRHLLQLINDVLDLAKVEAGRLEFHPERVDLRELVDEVMSILRTSAASRQVRLQASVESGLDDLQLDPARLKQVLYNYLSNALKFTPEGGRVTLRARAEEADRIHIEVQDTGIGIGAEDLNRLFVEFQQLDNALTKRQGGTGLGLALTRRLVEAQGGSVGVRSQVGQGSTFFVVLPRHTMSTRAAPKQPTLQAPPGAPVVLVVEDNPRDTEIIVRTLAEAGYGVELAGSGGQAIERARRRRFAAITLDLLLPDMSGIEALREIRDGDLNVDTPVVVVTVSAERKVMAGFAVQDVLPKPLDSTALIAALERSGVRPESPGTVLVLDDDLRALDLMQASLANLGYSAYVTSDGHQALARAREHLPVAVIVDLLMPGMNGFEFLEQFRELPSSRHVPVIVWTIKDLSASERATLRMSSQAVVPKSGGAALMEELRSFLPARPAVGPAARPEGKL